MSKKENRLYGFDLETHDPLLTDQGPSWVYRQGEIIVAGLYDQKLDKKRSFNGHGGKTIRELLLSASSTLVGANIGYDLGWACYEHKLKARDTLCGLIDVSIAESLIDEYQPFSLDALAQKYLGERKGHEKLADIAAGLGLKGDFRKHLKKLWEDGYQEEIREYVISDADQPVRIWEKQKKILEAEGLMPGFEMNMKMVRITLGMKQHGVRIDYAKWQENCAIAKDAYDGLKKDFTGKYGEVNINSPKQVAALFDRQGVPYKCKIVFKGWAPDGRKFGKDDWFRGDQVWDQRKRLKESFPNVRVAKGKVILMVPKQYAERTAMQAANMGYQVTCNPSVGKFTLNATKATYPVSADIVEYKQVSNIITKFLGPNFERFLVQDENGDWRLHGNFDPVGARTTGRLSASKPNLQNIPSKTILFAGTDHEVNLAHMCREVFIADRGHIFVKLDFSGQENVLQAHFAVGASGKRIRQMYTDNPRLDEHQFVADVSGLQETHGEKVGRKYAKNVRFGLAYGMQVTTMCEQFGWDKEFAEELIEAVKDASPWVSETMDYIQDMLLGKNQFQGRSRRYIKTILGRRVHLREGMDRDAYKFYNYLIQGSAADMMKQALIKYAESFGANWVGDELVLTVHDEGCFSVPATPQGIVRVLEIQRYFQSAVELSIPINADPEVGPNWADGEGQTKDKETKLFNESVEQLWDRVLSGKTDIVDKTEEADDDEDLDFDAMGEEDDEEEEDDE